MLLIDLSLHSTEAKVVLRESNDTVSGIYTFDPQTHDVIGFKSEDYARSCATGIERCAMVGYCSGHKPVRCEADAQY